jgi:hypothetical protein
MEKIFSEASSLGGKKLSFDLERNKFQIQRAFCVGFV